MAVMNLFPMTHSVNTALYLSNILCFLGNLLFFLSNPLHLGFLTRDIPFINIVPTQVAQVLNQFWHLAPVYFFRKRQTIVETFSVPSILLATFWFTCYLVLFSEPTLIDNYEMTRVQMMMVWYTVAALLLLFLYSKKLFQK
jgi:hypothetical protein